MILLSARLDGGQERQSAVAGGEESIDDVVAPGAHPV